MKVVGFKQSLPIDHDDSLIEFEKDMPTLGDYDLLVKISATSINPLDAKIRTSAAKDTTLSEPRVLGNDAVGVVEKVGPKAEGFKEGDRVWYAGDSNRDGANAEFQVVDARIVGHAPRSVSDAEAAVLPLTALTGWEVLFDRLRVDPSEEKTLLIIGGAGGVGSITTQIAKQVANLTVISTASRAGTEKWVLQMGADHVANHHDLVKSVKSLGFETVDYILNTADTKGHWDSMAELIAPQGMIASIVGFEGGVELSKLQDKSAGFVWEAMTTRPQFETRDMACQGDILSQLADLVDEGRIKSTQNDILEGLSANTLKEAHRRIESGKTIGKIAIKY